ncbi:hypothetical protein AXG93_1864s1400 [Marchantia polymorpha subsp. ruderalis]|uniref:Uncharacterized protein n=1 Tax=Marchantia polymorpha subsp. ruderalis TaxID=1480154 RepID=A0A176WRV6_MARPO|nr:hypothetical protein AXG93_1864s1400 [Marchantia polymorpha subsp. ruderalis]
MGLEGKESHDALSETQTSHLQLGSWGHVDEALVDPSDAVWPKLWHPTVDDLRGFCGPGLSYKFFVDMTKEKDKALSTCIMLDWLPRTQYPALVTTVRLSSQVHFDWHQLWTTLFSNSFPAACQAQGQGGLVNQAGVDVNSAFLLGLRELKLNTHSGFDTSTLVDRPSKMINYTLEKIEDVEGLDGCCFQVLKLQRQFFVGQYD